MKPIDIAPDAVLRAARWPAADLLMLTAGHQRELDAEQHSQRLQAELAALFQATLRDDDFCKALAVSHPELYGRLRRASCPTRWNKAARQLSATLYHHWARACWRTEPNGLWAGVGLAAIDAMQAIEASPPKRVAIAPHLAPFAALLASLADSEAHRAAYRRRGRYKVQPSAHREQDGVWVFDSADARGDRQAMRLRLTKVDLAQADRCIDAWLASGAASHAALVQTAAHYLHSATVADAFVDQLITARLLIGGLALPHAFDTAWSALDAAANELLPEHRTAWQATLHTLRASCHRLERDYTRYSADAIWQAMHDAARQIEYLADALGVPRPALPRACLHWDAGLPATARLDDAGCEQLRRALAIVEHDRAYTDPLPVIDQLHARALLAGDAKSRWQAASAATDHASLAAALADDGALLDRLSANAAAAPIDRSATPPFGALMLRLGRRADGQTSVLIQGLSHEPWLSYARFGALLGDPAPHAHRLHRWCADQLQRFANQTGVQWAQLLMPYAPLANLLAQPRFDTALLLDPHGVTPGAINDANWRVMQWRDRRWLTVTGVTRPVIALSATALNVGAVDHPIEQALLTSWRYRPPVQTVHATPHRPASTDPAIHRQRQRWTLDPADATALAHGTPTDRWARWQAIAETLQLPPLITVSRDGEAALLMPRDSVIAVEIIFRAAGAASISFTIEAPDNECLLTDSQGNRYATELVLVFARSQHGWSDHHTVAATASAIEPAEAVALAAE